MRDSFAAWFKAAGPEVQAALIGNAGITLAAIVTVVGTALFAIRQYRLERQEKARDRALAVKNDILFDSVRGASRALAALAGLSNLDRTAASISEEFQAGISALTVASAVADVETVLRARDFLNSVGPAFLQRSSARRPLDLIKEKLGHIQDNLDAQLAENRTILAMQRDAIASNDAARAHQTNAMFQVARKVFDSFEEERRQAFSELGPLHMQYIRSNMAMHSAIAPIFDRYVAAVRKDIGIDLSGPDAFLQAAKIDVSEVTGVLDKALDEIDQVSA